MAGHCHVQQATVGENVGTGRYVMLSIHDNFRRHPCESAAHGLYMPCDQAAKAKVDDLGFHRPLTLLNENIRTLKIAVNNLRVLSMEVCQSTSHTVGHREAVTGRRVGGRWGYKGVQRFAVHALQYQNELCSSRRDACTEEKHQVWVPKPAEYPELLCHGCGTAVEEDRARSLRELQHDRGTVVLSPNDHSKAAHTEHLAR
mmetsp:Transcript_145613/g.363195  ORF Transcript_145613/g.363195 Transcript_145613/m.363195 type:complete len:201 (-) Transcript_145613:1014-1616(-)